jgi:hypothetical protein
MTTVVVLGAGIGGVSQPVKKRPPKFPQRLLGGGVCGDFPRRPHTLAGRHPEDRLHDRVRNGRTEPYYEKLVLKIMGVDKLKNPL